jgi:hypothetical protein
MRSSTFESHAQTRIDALAQQEKTEYKFVFPCNARGSCSCKMTKKQNDNRTKATRRTEGLFIKPPRSVIRYHEPLPGKPLSLQDALAAIEFGHAPVLARYLREVVTPQGRINSDLAFLLASLLDNDPENEFRLDFVAKKRGGRKSGYNLTLISELIDAALGDPPNVEAAIAAVMQDTGISRATAFRAWNKRSVRLTIKREDWVP